ncbi:hypothetical protein NEF87_002985 [Candidatus Lokiarchaeum ossiferum]|uniref:Patatin family protein n=1 Tax=Candidatus Lokiarchaeum ossiferum TaxID=2951803 RepID=A0ABY6HTE6_9ARCH|nr:hypothetical protein NEF87_002985 [Candidatus Lokiarchaeum sp. B-35]
MEISQKIGLCCEGGGQRVVHTCGILDYFLEKDLHFPYVIGVSAGASNTLSYVSQQIGRNWKVDIQYIKDSRFLSLKNFVKMRSIFGWDFIFRELPNNLIPFDYDQYFNSSSEHVIGVTNAKTASIEYFYKSNHSSEEIMNITAASCSLPLITPFRYINDTPYLDGGVSDPIPVQKAFEDGCTKCVVILTQPQGYRKEPFKHLKLIKKMFKGYDQLQNLMISRHKMYNDTLDLLDTMESEGKVFILRPEMLLDVGRTTKNTEKLVKLFNQGYSLAKDIYNDLVKWVNED